MRKLTLLLPALFLGMMSMAQKEKDKGKDSTRSKTDSIVTEIKDDIGETVPTVTIDENDFDGGSQGVASLLTAGRDPFYNAASYNFNAVRFRIRGYDNDLNAAYLNGIQMDNLDNGFTPFGLWGGLNDVMRNRDLSIGLRYNTFAFGDIGSSTNIDARASKQRAQTQFGYALSNRNYTHRFTFYHGTGLTKKGWAFVVAGSRRYADEGYVKGTYYDSWSYFVGIDKKLGQKHLLSLAVFGAPSEYGKQGPVLRETAELAGTNYYNPYWGYQNGKVRNANVAKNNQPVIILTHEYRVNNKTNIVSGLGYTFGDRASTGLDWFNAPDPRPDYYRYLPSYQTSETLKQQVADMWRNNENVRQINWERLYDANRSSTETFNGTTGHRAKYLLMENVTNTQRINFNSVINSAISNTVAFTGGVSYQYQKNNYYKKVDDLLGADYFVDLNQFAERDFPSNNSVNQNDLNRPNRIVKEGERYGYDYDLNINKAAAWAQTVLKFNHVDLFFAAELSNTKFWRTGNVKSGLFPNNSYGKSQVNDFTNYAVKAGVTYKINGRNYLYVNGAYLTKAPFFENVYISPRTRDFQQTNTQSEKVQTVEGGYVMNSPKMKIRLTGYYTRFDNQMNVLSFYDDNYQNFVNYAISNIDKLHYGGEFGIEATIIGGLTANVAAAVGQNYYDSRQHVVVTADNTSSEIYPTGEFGTIYSQNYHVPGAQQAYTAGLSYRSPKFWFVSLSGSYFRDMWLDFNPVRRTYGAIKDIPEKSDLWNSILAQQELDPQFTLDMFAGWSWLLPKKWGFKKPNYLVFNLGINNLLNNQDITSGGYEQLRFDFVNKNVNKFPPKYFYAYGVNYFASVTYRF